MANDLEKIQPFFPIELPPEDQLGPAMRAARPLARKFVVALVELGAESYTRAALMTGHFATKESAQAWSSREMRNPKVREALREWTQTAMEGDVYLGRRALREIVSDPMHKDRLKAVDMLFNRNGMLVETVQRHIVEDSRSTREMIIEAVQLARKNGIDPRTLLGPNIPKDILDAEFTEVPDDGSEGLEDLL